MGSNPFKGLEYTLESPVTVSVTVKSSSKLVVPAVNTQK
jgi:hypothetical protein